MGKSIREMKIEASLERPHKECNGTKGPFAVVGVGTLIAAGLVIAGVGVWIVVAAELLALASAAYLYKKNAQKKADDYAFKVDQYQIQIDLEKARLVNGLIKDLKTWLSKAESHSESLLASFGIN